jgi:hypothetical protein
VSTTDYAKIFLWISKREFAISAIVERAARNHFKGRILSSYGLFCKILQSSPNRNFLRITTSHDYLDVIFSTFPAARPQTHLGVFQILGRESISKENFPGQRHFVSLYSSLQLVTVTFIRANPGLDFRGFFLQSYGADTRGGVGGWREFIPVRLRRRRRRKSQKAE